jgi:hypothetical protein
MVVDSNWEVNMKRLVLLVVATAIAGCDDTIPGQCKDTSDCITGGTCYFGFCVEEPDAGVPDSGIEALDSGIADAGGTSDGGTDARAPAPGGKWEAATCGGAFGDRAMANRRNILVGALSEPTPVGEGGSVEMKSSSHRLIGGFNAALHAK